MRFPLTRLSERRRGTSHSLSRSLFFFGFFIVRNHVHGQASVPSASPTADVEPPAIDPETIDPKTGLWEIAFHGATIMGNVWRIQNGYVGYYNRTDKVTGTNVHLREIDLTNPFPLGSIEEAPLNVRNIPEGIGSLWLSANWGSKNKLFAVGGETPIWDANAMNWPGMNKPASSYEIARYDVDLDKWDNIYPSDQGGQRIHRAAGVFTVEVPGTGKAYMLGGHTNNVPVDPPQLIVADFNENSDNPSWSRWNISTNLWRFRTFGSMVHVPFGDKGLLVLLGGADGHGSNTDGPDGGFRDGEKIDIYNLDAPSTGRDLEPGSLMDPVKASPDEKHKFPGFRKHPCSFVGIAPDNSSAQIFFYGGYEVNEHRWATGELWVLSIPSFDWIFLEDYISQGNLTNPGAKEGMTCNVFGTNYMMMYGGRNLPVFSKNRETTGMYAMDMSKVEWIEHWPGAREARAKKYTVPKKVVDIIGGTENGGSRKRWQENAEMDGKLVEFFNAHSAKVNLNTSGQPDSPGRPGTPVEPGEQKSTSHSPKVSLDTSEQPDSPGRPGTSVEPGEQESTSHSSGAIAGIAVGVVAGLVLIALGAFFFIQRRRAAEQNGYQKPELPDNTVTAVAQSPTYTSVTGDRHSDIGAQRVHEAPSGQETAIASEMPAGSSAGQREVGVQTQP